ncbi:hypothetical protein C8R44DRAFT_876603 [Mycena epipterygia]|nr:hypothetical protein C8R44DRAFT_876603 [Mycena epipterygia]
MFDSNPFHTITLLVLLPAISTATAQARCHKDLNVTVEVCTGALNPPTGCATIPALSDDCINLIGGFTFLNKEISSTEVPSGIVCTFFRDFGCTSGTGEYPNDGKVVLWEGAWDFLNIPVKDGTVNFNDLTSSFNCSRS